MRYAYPVTAMCTLIIVSCSGMIARSPSRDVEKIVTHTVDYGETWQSIARDFYGNEDRAIELAVYNGKEPHAPPAAGSGVRIPLSSGDLRALTKRLDAAGAYNTGLDLVSKGDYGEAVEKFRKALEIDPLFSDAAFNLAVTYQKLGLHGNAATVLEGLVSRSAPNPGYFYALGNSLFHTGRLKGAEEAFLKALSMDQRHLKTIFSLAVVYEKMNKNEDAKRLWERYLELDPSGEWAEDARLHLESLIRSGAGNS